MARTTRELSDDEKFCLDGYLYNGDSRRAYLLSRGEQKITASDTSLSVMVSRWMSSGKVKEYLKLRRRADYDTAAETTTVNRSRADAVKELNTLISSVDDARIRGDLLLKLADLQKWKQADVKDEDKTVNFYIPLSVERCIEFYARKLVEAGWDGKDEAEAVRIMRESAAGT